MPGYIFPRRPGQGGLSLRYLPDNSVVAGLLSALTARAQAQPEEARLAVATFLEALRAPAFFLDLWLPSLSCLFEVRPGAVPTHIPCLLSRFLPTSTKGGPACCRHISRGLTRPCLLFGSSGCPLSPSLPSPLGGRAYMSIN
jgi:hypothetical protein